MNGCSGNANQKFNFKVPMRLKDRLRGECLEMGTNKQSLTMTACVVNNDRQLFFFDGPQLKSEHDHSRCLERFGNDALKMWSCYDGYNGQRWKWDGERLKVESSGKCMDVPSSRAVYAHNCHGGDNQKFYFDSVEIGRTIRSDGKCLQIGSNRLAYWSTCTQAANQRFYMDGEAIKSEYINGCLDSYRNIVRLHVNCNGDSNQRWYWSGGHLKSKWRDDCLDVQPSNNTAFMGSCPDSDTVKLSFHNLLHNSVQLTVGNGRCLSRTDSGSTVEAVGCAGAAQQMWYFSGENLKTEFDDKCMDLNGGDGNIHMSNCHSNNDQKFYFDGENLRDRHFNRCLEYEVQSGNVFSGTCPDQTNHQWQFASQLALKKTPLPSAFVHGQSLEAKCWSERFTAGTLNSALSRTMSCVAGAWINSWNSPGLDGFTCSACVQVVSKVYADLDSQIRQELFFASGMKLVLSVDTRTRRTVTASGSLQEGGTADVFVAELMPNAAETARRYRSLSEEGKCLRALNLQLSSAECAEEAEADEMLEAGELGSLLWDEFQASADVPAASGAGLYNRGTAPTTLRSFNVDKDCSPHVMSTVQLSHNSLLGMSASCTAASTYGAAVQHTIAVPGAVQITSVSEGTCMSINEIIPWKLVIAEDSRCMDYRQDGSNNVYIHSCHGNNNQQWYMLDGNIISMRDNKCVDAHISTGNVYMHECHDGANQKWYFDEDTGAIRSEYDHRCLDKGADDNIYMHDCHSGDNQKFARQEVSSEAFITALHLDCIEDAGQRITVEPDGSNARFRLRAGDHTLSDKFTYDSDTQKIKNVANNKCLQARGRGRVDEMDCAQRIEQDWTISHGLPGLVDAPITCPGDQVISYLKKTHGQVQYKCSHVSSLGMCSPHYSTQVETKTNELETIKALRELGAFCPPGEGLKTLETEASDKGAWIRFKYECCQISRVPVSIYPLMVADDKRDFDMDMAEAWEGVYCPSGSDSSGRLDFGQRRSFKPGQTASGSLTYDKNLGKWCVSGKGCAQSDVVHPLDTQLHTDNWYVVPVSDFDAIFEARGAKQVSTTKRKPPPLIKFGASDPEYLPECKDESIPGARKFTLAKMNAEAQNLDDENPCKYVYGVPPTNSDMDNADGLTGWIDDLVGNVGPGQGGVTYKSVKECADRDDIRALQMAKWSQSHNYHSIGFGFVKDLWDVYADGMPEVEAAPLGAGFEFQPGNVMAAYGALYWGLLQMGEDIRLQKNEMHFEEAGFGDCNPLQHGFARTFCDLHCIRDAVRKGDDAILRAVEEAVEIIGKNTQILLEHYVGGESGSLVQEGTEIRRGLAAQLAELMATAQEAALQPRASQAAERAVRSFAGRWRSVEGGNASESLASLKAMAKDASELHATVMLVKGQRLSQVEEVQRNALETASRTNDFLKAKVHDLGRYHQTARRGKMVQRWFKQHWQNKFSMLDEFQDLSLAQAMQTFDTSWWEIRRELDAYLDAATEQARAMSSAVDALRGYTGKCQTSFEQLKNSYAASVRAEKKAHAVLKKTWSDVVFQAGLMASKITDAGLLDRLALADIKASKQPTVDKAQLPGFCSGSDAAALKLMHAHLAEVTGHGLLGQTQRQIGILFLEIAMLRHRFQTGGLGEAPNAEEAQETEERLGHALEAARSGANHLAADVVHHWRSYLCEP
ncbi:ath [Symbiodinium microadriaticum]|nr:ath [Symbiodinium microadriaticum]